MSACLSVLKTVMTVIPLYRFEPCAFRLHGLVKSDTRGWAKHWSQILGTLRYQTPYAPLVKPDITCGFEPWVAGSNPVGGTLLTSY